MNLRELVDLAITKALEYIVESDHEGFFEEMVDAAVMDGMDREDLYGINDQLDEYLKIDDSEDDEEDDDLPY
ncbi:MAG: hypothetical protein M0R77_02310 [Gammaproteobacteria bacterium]|nr:hypothetical protein [Gammaproteobacteria bacterium]